MEKFPTSLGTSPVGLGHDPRGNEMVHVSIQASTADGFRRPGRRRPEVRSYAVISHGYRARGAAVGPKSYRRPPEGGDSTMPRPLAKRERDGLGQRLPINRTGGTDLVTPGARRGVGITSHLGPAVHFEVSLKYDAAGSIPLPDFSALRGSGSHTAGGP